MGQKDKLTSGKLQEDSNICLSRLSNYNSNDKHGGSIYNYIKKKVPSSMLNCKLNINSAKHNEDSFLNLYNDIHTNDKHKIFNFPTTKFDHLFIDMANDNDCGDNYDRNGSINQNIASRGNNDLSVNKSKCLETDDSALAYLKTLNNGDFEDENECNKLCSYEKINEQNSESDWNLYLNNGSNIVTSSDIISSVESNVDTLTNSLGINIDLLNCDIEENNITEAYANLKDAAKGNNLTMTCDLESWGINNFDNGIENENNNDNDSSKILYNLAGSKLTGTSIMLSDKNEKYIYKIIPFFKNGESKFYMNSIRSYNKMYGTFQNENTQFVNDQTYSFYVNMLEKMNIKMGENLFEDIQNANKNYEQNINTINFYDESKKIKIKNDSSVILKYISDSIEKENSFLHKLSNVYDSDEKKDNNILAFLIKEKLIPKCYDIVPVYQCRENKMDDKQTNEYFCNSHEMEQSDSRILSNTSEKWKIFMDNEIMKNENKIVDSGEMGRMHLALKLKRICNKIKYDDQHLLDLKLGYNSIKDNDIYFNKELLRESESIDWDSRENYIKKWSKMKKDIRKIYKNNIDQYIIQITAKDLNLPEQFYKYNSNEIYFLLKSWKQEMSSLKTTQRTLGFRICAFIYYIKYANLLTTEEIDDLYNKVLKSYSNSSNNTQNGKLKKYNEKKIEINECYDKLNHVLKISREYGMRLHDELVLYFLEIFLKNVANIILPKLVKLKIWLENQSLYTFCSTSILIIYDKNNPSSCDMRWIDFTYSFENFNYFKNDNPINKKFNSDIIFGINNLIKICKNIIVNKNIPIPISSNDQKEKNVSIGVHVNES
ncbi:kinase, putative [Plasmodium vinckei brucechwatti]|uniref:Kinase n=1 Tax=Plasmodium vinckei brucechwatti TaxID=119398 RepID=A0A6V7S980_PLAVN|nr:kinase, putative [Plasmodium vinckei brucechwatti]